LIDPNTLTVTSAGQETYARLYHSGALLLPNATVAVLGGNPHQGTVEEHIEIYSPAYLFNPDGSAATQPVIASAPPTINYGGAFQVQSPDAANIASVVLIPPGTPTHSFDNSARLVGLSFTTGAGELNLIGPPTSSIAPPGNYMMFLVNNAGVPSNAAFVNLTLTPAAIARRGGTSRAGNPTKSMTLSAPSGLQANDVMVAQVVVRNLNAGAVTVTPPIGWTLVRSDASLSATQGQFLYVKVAGPSEPSSYTWTTNVSVAHGEGIEAFYNVNTSAPIDKSSGQYNATATTSDSAPSVTTTHTADELLSFMGSFIGEGTANWTLPSGMSKRWIVEGADADADAVFANQLLSVSGATSARTGSLPTSATSVGALIALAPAGG
jgi:hypothetical protein